VAHHRRLSVKNPAKAKGSKRVGGGDQIADDRREFDLATEIVDMRKRDQFEIVAGRQGDGYHGEHHGELQESLESLR
jgi:hypothetical protein